MTTNKRLFSDLEIGDRFEFVADPALPYSEPLCGPWIRLDVYHYRHEFDERLASVKIGKTSCEVHKLPPRPPGQENLTSIEITARHLFADDRLLGEEGDLQVVADVSRHDSNIRGMFSDGYCFNFQAGDRLLVLLNIAVGKLYLAGQRDNDKEWRVVRVEAPPKGEHTKVWIAGDAGPCELLTSFFIREATPGEIASLYLKYRGGFCPYCRSPDMEGGSGDTDDNWHAADVTCNNCGATWQDIYTLNRINNAQSPWNNEQTAATP
mgnify:CR=1 FL=1